MPRISELAGAGQSPATLTPPCGSFSWPSSWRCRGPTALQWLTCGCGTRKASQGEPADCQQHLKGDVRTVSRSHSGRALPEIKKHTESDLQPPQAGVGLWGRHTHRDRATRTRRGRASMVRLQPANAKSSAAMTQGWADQGMKALSLSRLCPAAQRPGDGWNFILGARAHYPPE